MLAPLHLCMYMCVCAYLLCYLNGVIVRAAMRPTVKCEIDLHYGALACLNKDTFEVVVTEVFTKI